MGWCGLGNDIVTAECNECGKYKVRKRKTLEDKGWKLKVNGSDSRPAYCPRCGNGE